VREARKGQKKDRRDALARDAAAEAAASLQAAPRPAAGRAGGPGEPGGAQQQARTLFFPMLQLSPCMRRCAGTAAPRQAPDEQP
jgi:hypothetical protein